jgi:DNA (cytosine-5)-methyltransferase 1
MKTREVFIRVKEAASLLGVAPNTVRAWGAASKIPEYRHPVNRYRLYKRADIESLLEELRAAAEERRPKPR